MAQIAEGQCRFALEASCADEVAFAPFDSGQVPGAVRELTGLVSLATPQRRLRERVAHRSFGPLVESRARHFQRSMQRHYVGKAARRAHRADEFEAGQLRYFTC